MSRILLVTLACAVFAGTAGAAAVTGKVSFLTRRGQRPVGNETLVWLEPAVKAAPLRGGANDRTFSMTTRGKTFLPHVLAVPAGSTVAFPNEDPISHNLFSLTPGAAFDLGLYRKGAGKTRKFDAPAVVNVYCNIHPGMSAVLHVLDTPYYGFADSSGNFSLDVPAGKYRLNAWNEQGGTVTAAVEVRADGTIAGSTALTIDGRNFRQSQHTNKFGQAYRPPKDY